MDGLCSCDKCTCNSCGDVRYVVVENKETGEWWMDSYRESEIGSKDNPNGKLFNDITNFYGTIVFRGSKQECEEYVRNMFKG